LLIWAQASPLPKHEYSDLSHPDIPPERKGSENSAASCRGRMRVKKKAIPWKNIEVINAWGKR